MVGYNGKLFLVLYLRKLHYLLNPPLYDLLLSFVLQIKAIDNHSHPPALDGPHGERDTDFDALPCDPLEPTDAGLFFREDNPVYIKAWQKMFGYKYDDMAPEHA